MRPLPTSVPWLLLEIRLPLDAVRMARVVEMVHVLQIRIVELILGVHIGMLQDIIRHVWRSGVMSAFGWNRVECLKGYGAVHVRTVHGRCCIFKVDHPLCAPVDRLHWCHPSVLLHGGESRHLDRRMHA